MLPLHVKEQSPSGLHGFPEPEWLPPLVDVTGSLDGISVWIGHIRIKTFTNLTLASRFAEKLRGVIGD